MRFKWFVLMIIPIYFLACRTTPKEKGYEYFSDMVHTGSKLDKDGKTVIDNKKTTGFEAFDLNVNFTNNITAQKPVMGTIPRNYKLYNFPYRGTFPKIDMVNKVKDAEEAGKTLPANALEGLRSVLSFNNKKKIITIDENAVYERGNRLYHTFCVHCHGEIGSEAPGLLASKGMAGPNLAFPPASVYPAGRLFYVITMGNSIMPSHASQISPDDRWRIVYFIKKEIEKVK
ncbi:MAG: cytochrome c [Spirochaetota bacterium]|nr:cytochrome c [Spirochaetota bacterium]